MKKIEEIGSFSKKCGYLYNAYIEKGIIANSGYNCKHPSQKEIYEEHGEKVGLCYCFSCPLGKMATEDDFENKNILNTHGRKYEEGRFIVID